MRMLAFSIAGLVGCCAARTARAQGAAPGGGREAVIAVEHRWLAATDSASLAGILAPDFVHPVPSGDFLSKSEQIAWVSKHPRPSDAVERFTRLDVRLYGDVAIANGEVVAERPAGHRVSRIVFTDVFTYRDGRWQAVNGQENAVPPGAGPSAAGTESPDGRAGAVSTYPWATTAGSTPPGPADGRESVPTVFAPGVISGPANDLSPAFTPDGRTVFFTRGNSERSVIMVSDDSGGGWAPPGIAPFSGEWRDLEPAMAPDGSYLVFASNRPVAEGGKPLDGAWNGASQPLHGGNLWRVDRTPSGWGDPQRLPDAVNAGRSVFAPSLASDGSLYFMRPSGPLQRFHLFRAQWARGTYQAPVAVPVSASDSVGDFDPAVAPDESFLVFSSARLRDKGTSLFVTFRYNGVWSAPRYLGDTVSAPGTSNIEARLGPGARTLYFSSTRLVRDETTSDHVAAERSLERVDQWNDGLQNIWQVPIGPWLSEVHMAAPPAAPPEIRLSSAPAIVAPGTVSTPAAEFAATRSPDARTLVYVVTDPLFRHLTIVEAHRRGGRWAAPAVASFSGVWRDADPAFAPDGRTLFFISNRPLPGDPPDSARRDFNIWSVPRRSDGSWGRPVPLDRAIDTDTSEFAPSVTASGDLYFSRGDHVFRAQRTADGFWDPEVLPLQGAGDPAVSPDGRFIVFDADGPRPGDADLFVSCRTAAGWSAPMRFAEPVNSPQEEGDPKIAADGHTMFFFSRRRGPAASRAPRSRRATYAQVEHEAIDEVYNGSRNLFTVDLSPIPCTGS